MRATLVMLAVLTAMGCSTRDSIVVVSLSSATPIAGVSSVRVDATAGGRSSSLSFKSSGGAATTMSFGIEVPHGIVGAIAVDVQLLAADGKMLATGKGSGIINVGGRSDIMVTLGGVPVSAGDMSNPPAGDMAQPLGGSVDMATAAPGDMAQPIVKAAKLSIDKPTQDFGPITINKTSLPGNFVITNTGNAATGALAMVTNPPTAPDFAITTDCGAALPPLGHCSVSATMAPKTMGMKDATFTVSDGALMVTGEVKGNALLPGQLSITPDSGDCGSALLSKVSGTTASFTVKNTGQSATGTLSIKLSDDQFAPSGCAQSLTPMSTCSVTVTFTAKRRGTAVASLSVGDGPSDPMPATASVKGVALQPAIVNISPNPGTFTGGPRGQAADSVIFTVTNTGDVATNSLASSISGTNLSAFAFTARACDGTNLPPGPPGCTYSIQFTPQFTGTHNAALTVNDSTGTLASTPLTGKGTPIWVRETLPSPPSGSLRTVFAQQSRAWVAGDNGALFGKNTGAWRAEKMNNVSAPAGFVSLTGSSATDLWVTSPSFSARSFGDGNWTVSTANGNQTVEGAIWAVAPGDVWETQTTTMGAGTTFSQVTTAIKHLSSGSMSETAYQGCAWLWGKSDTSLYCAYNQLNCPSMCFHDWGVAKRGSNGAWTLMADFAVGVANVKTTSIWGSSDTDVYVATTDARPRHYDGSSWTVLPVSSNAPGGVLGIWLSAANDVWFAGPFGIVRGDGTTWGGDSWSPDPLKMSLSATAVYGTSPNDVYVVGSDSGGMAIYHWY